ncbi:MAG TPA: HNH endonuclease signature motif containing protein, partial [Steroidobacteraceae bacterium]|nr:HNH endonuclease signature motif containing protein [Steroidobacteraceae bacterium]
EDENGTPLDIARKTRSIPPSIRRALNSRDKGCRFPGCCNKKFVDGHHIKHWANGGETKLSNLVSLCRFHHRLVHEGGVEVHALDDGAIRFVKPNGQSFDSVIPGFTQPLSHWYRIPAQHERAHLHINDRTAATKWGGESMDYGLAVQVLLQQNAKSHDEVMR